MFDTSCSEPKINQPSPVTTRWVRLAHFTFDNTNFNWNFSSLSCQQNARIGANPAQRVHWVGGCQFLWQEFICIPNHKETGAPETTPIVEPHVPIPNVERVGEIFHPATRNDPSNLFPFVPGQVGRYLPTGGVRINLAGSSTSHFQAVTGKTNRRYFRFALQLTMKLW